LREAVASVLAQTYRPIEIILIDDGSTDDTPEVVKALHQNHPGHIRALRTDNTGPGLAREAGRLIALGEYIQYLDSDDLLLSKKFALQVAGLDSNPNYAISYCKTRYRDPAGNIIDDAWKRTGEHIESLFPSMLQGRWWGTSTPMYRRSAVDSVGPWSEITNEEDWEYDCRFAAKGVKLHYVPETLSEERGHAENRLSEGGSLEPDKLSSRARAHEMIYMHAIAAGMATSSPEMQHFSRECFLLARQCGAAGLSAESRTLFELARTASGIRRQKSLDFLIYRVGAAILGWGLMGTLSAHLDRIRK
ncbi:MAG: glycosyltransferase family A protein, partial [Verrucomicrobia bacterium]|nr:glycosyltransferase family A protein [Verrucomicrobiota bacterium]